MSVTPRSPLVVVDWNFLQTVSTADLQRNRLGAPSNWDFLLPESVSHEVLEKKDTARIKPEQYLSKIVKFCCEYRDRFWLGKSNGPICELSPQTMRIADIVEIEYTLRTRRNLMHGGNDFAKLVQQGRAFEGHQQFRKCEDGFVALSKECRDFLKQYDPNFDPNQLSDREITKIVRDPESALRWLPKEWVKSHGLTNAQIARFPDIVSMGRWFRVHIWYDLQRYKMIPSSKSIWHSQIATPIPIPFFLRPIRVICSQMMSANRRQRLQFGQT